MAFLIDRMVLRPPIAIFTVMVALSCSGKETESHSPTPTTPASPKRGPQGPSDAGETQNASGDARKSDAAIAQHLKLTLPRSGSTKFRVSIQNRSSQLGSLVVPSSTRLQSYGSWGGWHWRIMQGSKRYAPYPMPGPYIPAIPADVISLSPGEMYEGELDIGSFVPTGAIESPPLRSQGGSVSVSLEWREGPAQLQVQNWVHPASAAVEWKRPSEGK